MANEKQKDTLGDAPPPPHTEHSLVGGKKKKKPEKAFVFDNYPRRKIAIRVAYHGHVHDGLAKQEETENTIEGIVVVALKRVRLIPETGPEAFSRCGRTDKGVSALGNALSFVARASCWPGDEPQKPPLDYAHMLNGVLPPTIRIVGFALVADSFDARFSCISRTYRYYFCHRGLNLAAMKSAAQQMLGTHNFRNFCKMDVVNVSNFERTVTSVGIYESELLPELISYFEIQANSFLYHQIRCTMEVLFLIGRGLESPNVVNALLERGDHKPQYSLADGTPLILWDCGFRDSELTWHISHRAFQSAERELQDICTALLIRATASDAMRRQLFRWYQDAVDVCSPHMSASSHANSKTENSARDMQAHEEAHHQRVVLRRPRARTADDHDNRDVADARVVDGWSITGCDWTEPRTHAQLKVRKYDLFNAFGHEDAQVLANGSSATALTDPTSNGGQVYVPKGYVPLLERETERTYAEQVAELGGKKRARFELNEEKKAAGAARVAAERAQTTNEK